MRIAALYDIHGNLPALEAVLDEVAAAGPDLVVIGGDVLPGPLPAETLGALAETRLPLACIHGNGDREVLATLSGAPNDRLPERARTAIAWTASQVASWQATLAGWSPTLTVAAEAGQLLFCHATPADDVTIFTRLTPTARVADLLAGTAADWVFCGHTHMPFDRRVGPYRVVNPGSVGMPFGEPGAYWALIDGGSLTLRRTSYDLARAADLIRRSGYPQAAEFADRNVLDPPTEAEMLRVLDPAAAAG
ncbi:MAG: metallophosphoesterase [Gemmatimonadales bacterium]